MFQSASGSDQSDDGEPVALLLTLAGAEFQITAECLRAGALTTGSIRIASAGTADWSVDSTAPIGVDNDVDLDSDDSRILIQVGSASGDNFHTGTFTAAISETQITLSGYVSVRINRNTHSCDWNFVGFGRGV